MNNQSTIKNTTQVESFPQVKQTEFAVMSLMLKHNDNIEVAISQGLNIESFFDVNCRNLFKAVVELKKKGAYVDPNSVYDQLQLMHIDFKYDGIQTLLKTYVEYSDKLPDLCKTLKDYEKQRQLVSIAKEIGSISYMDKTIDEKLDLASSELNKIVKDQDDNIYCLKSSYKSVLEVIQENIDRKGKNNMSWIFHQLDLTLGGIHTGLHVIGAYPGRGKTSFIDQIIDYNAEQGKSTLFFSCEMNLVELMYRKIQRELGIDANRLRRGDVYEQEFDMLNNFDSKLNDNVILCDSSNLEITRLKSIAKIKAKKHNLKMIVIDYLQLLKASYKKSRYEEITEISMQLKALSKELKIPVVALSQLNRQSAKSNEEPNLSDLRESGQIEQDADSVMFIHRPAMYDKTSPLRFSDGSEFAKIIVAKNRYGRVEDRWLKFIGSNVKFVEPTDGEPVPEEILKAFDEAGSKEEKKVIKFK